MVMGNTQYIPWIMSIVRARLYLVVVGIHRFVYICQVYFTGNQTITSSSRKLPWRVWVNKLHASTNPSPPSAAYMRLWIGSALVQIMACRLFGAKPLSKPIPGYCQLDLYEQTSVKFYKNSKVSIHKNTFEYIVCKIAAILSQGRWANYHNEYKQYKQNKACFYVSWTLFPNTNPLSDEACFITILNEDYSILLDINNSILLDKNSILNDTRSISKAYQ